MMISKQCTSSTFEQDTSSACMTVKLRERISLKPRNHKKTRFGSKKGTERQHFNSSLWTLAENTAYMNFLAHNLQLFNMTKIQRRDSKINVMMSKAIGTRSADQCRSHHQKMIKYHADIPTIIAHIVGLQQNQGENPISLHQIQQKWNEPVLLDFFEEEGGLENLSFCEQLMNEEWNVI